MSAGSSWFFWAFLSAVFAAMTAIFAKLGLKGMDSDFAAFLRSAMIIFILGLFVLYAGKWSNPLELSARNWTFLALSALATGGSWVCYFRALSSGDVSRVAPVDKLSLVLVALFSVFLLGERPTPVQWSGIGLVSAGVLVLSLSR